MELELRGALLCVNMVCALELTHMQVLTCLDVWVGVGRCSMDGCRCGGSVPALCVICLCCCFCLEEGICQTLCTSAVDLEEWPSSIMQKVMSNFKTGPRMKQASGGKNDAYIFHQRGTWPWIGGHPPPPPLCLPSSNFVFFSAALPGRSASEGD